MCPETIASDIEDAQLEKGWVAFKVRGPLDFSWTGILAGLSQPLAEDGIPIFAISTYDTDYVLVKEKYEEKAAAVFMGLSHTVESDQISSQIRMRRSGSTPASQSTVKMPMRSSRTQKLIQVIMMYY